MAAKTNQIQEAWAKWRLTVRRQLIHRLTLRGSTKVILVGIMDCLRGEKWCWPSDDWLAKWSGCSVKTVQRHREKLVRMGLIEMNARFERSTGRQQSNWCRIVWQKVGELSKAAPMAAWDRPPRLRYVPVVALPPTSVVPVVALPPTSVVPVVALPTTRVSPLEPIESQRSEKNPPLPPGWPIALAAVAEVLKVRMARDRASSEAWKHGLSSDDVLALVNYYRSNASAFRSAGILSCVLRNAPAGCAANPGEHFPSLPPNQVEQSRRLKRRDHDQIFERIKALEPDEVRAIMVAASDKKPSLWPVVEAAEAEGWRCFNRDLHWKILASGLTEGVFV